VQIVVAAISYLTLYRHRVVCSIRTAKLIMPHGAPGSPGEAMALKTEHIDEKLASGKYTVLQIVERDADKDLEIILGQIKK